MWSLIFHVFAALYALYLVDASVVFTSDNGTHVALPSTDYYLHPEAYYNYTGIALYWRFGYDRLRDECVFAPVNTTDPQLHTIAGRASGYAHFAIVLNYPPSVYVDCKSKEQMDRATTAFLDQLATAGFPPVDLFLLVGHAGRIVFIVDDYILHSDHNPFRNYIRSAAVKIAIVKKDKAGTKAPSTKLGAYTIYHYHAVQEANQWNQLLLSPENIIPKWFCFTLVLQILVYALARVARLVSLRMLSFDLLVLSFIVTIIYAIFLLLHYLAPYNYNALDKATFIYSFLSRVPFDLILWHWSVVGRNLFSRRAVLFFRAIIIVDFLSNVFRLVFMVMNLDQPEEANNGLKLYGRLINIASAAIPAMNTAIFGGLKIIYDMAYLMRAIAFLLVLGVYWPMPKSRVVEPAKRASFSEMAVTMSKTTIDDRTKY
ncbi:hypothetical protein SYNPS1DRAFT_20741 [Syncephalis pseudoplumigaleata]|uniref:Uncharacterized protein n=1 Tax=Syncephalis pseudoplumigaleata TaxID=1712513 RepID=A0A4P9Z5F1_9FUNG|nr:hypothetical protein SYNPS1DRAFT_20741 [Syncephalis pseudoplumigaleata]|eukprot:RKP27847.1 hypothetical protein SYNPS1DRAFT_20741 [Syncephalis pseudoplumigaleata]